MPDSGRKVLTLRQQDNEPLAEYYKIYTSCVDVAESQWEPSSADDGSRVGPPVGFISY
jgi:hypothetical protein